MREFELVIIKKHIQNRICRTTAPDSCFTNVSKMTEKGMPYLIIKYEELANIYKHLLGILKKIYKHLLGMVSLHANQHFVIGAE